MVLFGTIPLQYILPLQQAYMVWGVVLPILFFIITLKLLRYLAKILYFPPLALLLVLSLFVFNNITWNAYFPLNVDHHYVLTVLFLMLLAQVLLAVQAPDCKQHSLLAGISLAAGIWVSPEFMLPAAGILAGVGGLWLWQPDRTGRVLPQLLSTATLGIVVAVGLERADPLQVVHDSVSIVHAVLFLLCSVCATVLVQGVSVRPLGVRLAATVAGVATVLCVMQWLFPDFWRAHYLATDAFVIRELLAHIAELQPLPRYISPLFCAVILALAVIGGAWGRLWMMARNAGNHAGAWTVILSAAGSVAVLSVLQGRWMSAYGMPLFVVLAALPLWQGAEMLRVWLQRYPLAHLQGFIERFFFLLAPAALMGVTELLNPVVFPASVAGQDNRLVMCQQQLIRFTQQDGFSRVAGNTKQPLILMMPTNYAGVVWFWTPHTVIAGNYHRDTAGIRDVITFFRADEPQAAEIITRRNVDMIAYCAGETSKRFFLHSGSIPAWLVPMTAVPHPDIRLYQVRRR
jgi:hypothetical protein